MNKRNVCYKCNNLFLDKWESGKEYLGIDEHHNPPEEISRFLKEQWKGKFYRLCRKCHQNLHKEITIILKKYSNKPNYNSDYWLMMHSTPLKIKEAQEEIYNFTEKWINIKEGENGDTTTA